MCTVGPGVGSARRGRCPKTPPPHGEVGGIWCMVSDLCC